MVMKDPPADAQHHGAVPFHQDLEGRFVSLFDEASQELSPSGGEDRCGGRPPGLPNGKDYRALFVRPRRSRAALASAVSRASELPWVSTCNTFWASGVPAHSRTMTARNWQRLSGRRASILQRCQDHFDSPLLLRGGIVLQRRLECCFCPTAEGP